MYILCGRYLIIYSLSFKVIAFFGHFSAQIPQPTHFAESIECFSLTLPPIMASNLQFLKHIVQPTQLS